MGAGMGRWSVGGVTKSAQLHKSIDRRELSLSKEFDNAKFPDAGETFARTPDAVVFYGLRVRD